jgi:hypothetical protein
MKVENNDCPCKRIKCERHGNCDACKEHHQAAPRKIPTACERIVLKEERKQRRAGS